MLEGSQQGVAALNRFRELWGLPAIPIKWHNLFFDDAQLEAFMAESGYALRGQDGLGAYFMLTRGVRPTLDATLNWNARFNEIAASPQIAAALGLGAQLSRLKLWCFQE